MTEQFVTGAATGFSAGVVTCWIISEIGLYHRRKLEVESK